MIEPRQLRTRRWFLSAAGASIVVTACSQTSNGATKSPSEGSGDGPIVVIGAGMAGLTAARALHDGGHEVIVVEARDRIGGRTFTTQVGAATVDLGGAWIHGPKDNPLAQFADANAVPYREQVLVPDLFYDAVGGGIVPLDQMAVPLDEAEGFTEATPELLEEMDADASLAEAMAQYYDRLDLDGINDRRARFATEAEASELGGSFDDLSYVGATDGEDRDFAGGDHVIEGGYATIVDLLADGLDIRTSTPIRRVDHRDSERVVLSTDAGEITAARVIVTVPLGVLKAGSIEFLPELPARKMEAIDSLGMGSFEKVVFVFAERFWDDQFEMGIAYLAGLGDDLAYPLFFDMTEFAGAPTLVCLYAGAFAAQTQTMDPDEIAAACLDVLREVLGAVPEPESTVATSWTNDPYSLGSYSYIAVESDADDARALAEPIGGIVLFAGEATSVEAYQTVHGAFMSGLREAQRIDPATTV